MVNKFNNKFLRLVKSVLIFFIILLLWKITNYLGIWSDYILPSPEKVYSTFLNMISDGSIFINVYASMKRVLIGFAISTAIGVPLGIFFGIYSGVYEYFKSLINFKEYTSPCFNTNAYIMVWYRRGIKNYNYSFSILFPNLYKHIERD